LLNELLRITFFEADNQQSRPSITDLKRICADLVDKESDAEVRQGLTDIRDKLHNVYQ